MTSLDDSGFKKEEDHHKIQIVAALFVTMPANYLDNMEICNLIQVNLRSIPLGWQPLKKYIWNIFIRKALFLDFTFSTIQLYSVQVKKFITGQGQSQHTA